MSRSFKGNFVKSLWCAFTFTWFLNWVAFLYAGLRTNKNRWIGWSMFYFFTCFIIPLFIVRRIADEDDANILLFFSVILWIVSIIHAFVIRKECLMLIDCFASAKHEKNEKSVDNGNIPSEVNNYTENPEESVYMQLKPENLVLSAENKKKVKDFVELINQIKHIQAMLSQKSAEGSKYSIIDKFFSEYKDELLILDSTYVKYCGGVAIIDKYANIDDEIKDLEEEINGSSDDAKELYIKTLHEKQSIKQEYEKIKSFLETSESKLNYILSILEKIQVTAISDLLDNNSDNSKSEDLESKLSTFSDNIKSVLKSMDI